MNSPKMMPGQKPYTPEEWRTLGMIIAISALAESVNDPDELEQHAAMIHCHHNFADGVTAIKEVEGRRQCAICGEEV